MLLCRLQVRATHSWTIIPGWRRPVRTGMLSYILSLDCVCLRPLRLTRASLSSVQPFVQAFCSSVTFRRPLLARVGEQHDGLANAVRRGTTVSSACAVSSDLLNAWCEDQNPIYWACTSIFWSPCLALLSVPRMCIVQCVCIARGLIKLCVIS